jgi:hypothetical protein
MNGGGAFLKRILSENYIEYYIVGIHLGEKG